MPTCIAPGCKSGYKSQVTKSEEPGYEKISFFTVPEDPAIIALWQQSLNRKDFTVKAGQFVCGGVQEEIERGGNRLHKTNTFI